MSYYFPNTHNEDINIYKWRAKLENIKAVPYTYHNYNLAAKTSNISYVEGVVTLCPPGWSDEELTNCEVVVFERKKEQSIRRPKVVQFKEYTDKIINSMLEIGEGNFFYVWGKITTGAYNVPVGEFRLDINEVVKDFFNGQRDPQAAFLTISSQALLSEFLK